MREGGFLSKFKKKGDWKYDDSEAQEGEVNK